MAFLIPRMMLVFLVIQIFAVESQTLIENSEVSGATGVVKQNELDRKSESVKQLEPVQSSGKRVLQEGLTELVQQNEVDESESVKQKDKLKKGGRQRKRGRKGSKKRRGNRNKKRQSVETSV